MISNYITIYIHLQVFFYFSLGFFTFYKKSERSLLQESAPACRESLDTLGDFEKGRYIFRSCIRRRTRVRQSARTEKASKHKDFSMKALCLSFYKYILLF